MSHAAKFVRGLSLGLPFALLSGLALYAVQAQQSQATIPTGAITGKVTDYASYPNGTNVGITAVPPVAMIVASTDEQLFYKAYTDYTDMTGKGSPDITYNNNFEYQGYFNPNVCYTYSASTFVPSSAATSHQCQSRYSGNFMNWATMSRLDMLRYAMYGGWRTVDTASQTVVTRSIIPNDGHAWVKVYTGSDLSSYLPYTGSSISLCSATTGNLSSASSTSAGLHIAKGTYTQWASMESSQCNYSTSDANAPYSGNDFVVSVQVCDGTYDTRSMCKTYGTSSIKPTGVLQQFGESDSTQQIRFALMTGSRNNPRSGGALRKNASFIEGNLNSSNAVDHTCATNTNELSLADGTFCSGNQGIISNLSSISLNSSNNYWTGSVWNSCSTYGIYNRYPGFGVNGILDNPGVSGRSTNTYHCGAWGNPVTEMYAEALRYVSGQSSATSGFYVGSDYVSGMSGGVTWSPPLTESNYCASCAIVLISSGQVTFDGDEIPALSGIVNYSSANGDINAATDSIGNNEGINGNSYIVGRMLTSSTDLAVGNQVNTTSDVCQPQTVGQLSLARGICPDGASMEGSYLLSGLAWQAWVNGITLANISSAHNLKPVHTYAVALSESMPTFQIPTSAGSVTLAPLCQSSNTNHAGNGGAPAESGAVSDYRTCGLLSLQLGQLSSAVSPNYTYGQTFNTTGQSGSFTVIWDDSTWGNDHDLDVTSLVSWCVGAACGSPSNTNKDPSNFCWNTNVNGAQSAVSSVATATSSACTGGHLRQSIASNQVLVRTEMLTASAGNDMSSGFSITGVSGAAGTSSGNGVHRTFWRPGNQNYNLITGQSNYPTQWTTPQVEVFTASASSTGSTTLQNPLWYAAKYSGFPYKASGLGQPAATADIMPTSGTGNNWQGPDGNPANYFLARNPSALVAGLQSAFQQIANSGISANDFGNADSPSSSNDFSGNGLSYQVQYFATRNGVNWTGSVQAFWSNAQGYLQEGSLDSSGNEILSSTAPYVVSGPDTSGTNAPGTLANYTCPNAPIPAAGSAIFDPSANGTGCRIVSTNNPLIPAWDGTTLLNAYYDPSASTYSTIKQNIETQRSYSADAGIAQNLGQRYIFTYLTAAPNAQTQATTTQATTPAAGTLIGGTQTDFVWNTQTCSATGTCALSSTSGFFGNVTTTNVNVRLGNYGLLNEKSPALAQKLLNWVRGEEDTADFRSRTSNDKTSAYTYRLGDIVDSSPAVVNSPAMGYDQIYSDLTYAAFRTNYRNRRQMIYVGANDGMLHAFNSGFYVPAQLATSTTQATNAMVARTLPSSMGNTGSPSSAAGNNWSLGQEVWAFVPDNLLPHLRWMADKNYTHVFYVDGSPVVTDVQVWGTGSTSGCKSGVPGTGDTDSAGHVCGWGTVMVVPFHLGGGPITVDTIGDAKTSSQQTSNSAYVILDVTDPEQPPTVLGEITTGTYTLGQPIFAVHREASDGKLHFLLTIGSGTADNGGPSGTGTKPVSAPAGSNLGVWVYDMANVVAKNSSPVATFTGTGGGGPANSFAGDMSSADFDLNYSAEAVYFGVVTNPPTTATPQNAVYGGGLWKLDMYTGAAAAPDTSDPSTWRLKQVYAAGVPITIRPTLALDTSNRRMIYFGSGRSYTPSDDSGILAQGVQQQYIYGVSDNSLLGLPASCPTTLFDATSVSVTANGAVSTSGSGSLPGNATSLPNLESALLATIPQNQTNGGCYQYAGWQLALAAGNSNAQVQQPSERVISSQALFNSILLTPTYTPPSQSQINAAGYSSCNPIPVPGVSNLYGMDYLTGTAAPALAGSFGTAGGSATGAVLRSVSLGSGKASSPTVRNGTANLGIDNTNLGVKTAPNPNPNGTEISWREQTDNQ